MWYMKQDTFFYSEFLVLKKALITKKNNAWFLIIAIRLNDF